MYYENRSAHIRYMKFNINLQKATIKTNDFQMGNTFLPLNSF